MDDHSQVFSHPRWRPLTMALNLIVLIIISSLCARRVPDTVAKWRAISATNLAICATLLTSLLYVTLATFVVFGLGSSRSVGVCSFALWLCALMYAGAKVLMSIFLVERARLVSAPMVPRLKNKLYLFNFTLLGLWLVGCVCALVWRQSSIRPSDGECLIALGKGTLGLLIGIDVFLNVYYTLLFVVPLLRGKWQNPKLKQLAIKSALAAVLTVSSSVANLGLFTAHHSSELSWVCLSTCTLDTVWCAVILCALTSSRDDGHATEANSQHDPSRSASRAAAGPPKPDGVCSHHLSAPAFGADASEWGAEGVPVAGWGSFGRIELGEAGVVSGGGGASGSGRRGSFAPDEMCLGAVNERKVVDGAWKAPSPRLGGEESEEDEKEGGVEEKVPQKVEFAD